MIIYFDLDFLRHAAALVDSSLERLAREADTSPDPDSFGVFDQMEYVAGFGFVACQTYATAKVGERKLKKGEASALGPRHRTGRPMVQLINAAANYWKHSPQWSLDAPTPQAKRTLEAISSLGVDTKRDQYPIAHTLYEILTPHPARIASLIPVLIQWRDALRMQIKLHSHPD